MSAPCSSATCGAIGTAISAVWISAGKTEKSTKSSAMKKNIPYPMVTKTFRKNRPTCGGTAWIVRPTIRFLPWVWKTFRALKSCPMKPSAITFSVLKAASPWAWPAAKWPKRWASSWWPHLRGKSRSTPCSMSRKTSTVGSAAWPLMKMNSPSFRKRNGRLMKSKTVSASISKNRNSRSNRFPCPSRPGMSINAGRMLCSRCRIWPTYRSFPWMALKNGPIWTKRLKKSTNRSNT